MLPVAFLFSSTVNAILPLWNISIIRVAGNGTAISLWYHDWGMGILKNIYEVLHTYAIDDTITLAQTAQMGLIEGMFRTELSTQAT